MATQRPNIVFILADDLGYDDLGLNGNTIVQTPNIDALGAESLRLEDFTVILSALPRGRHCSPASTSCAPAYRTSTAGRISFHWKKAPLPMPSAPVAMPRECGAKWHSGFTEGYLPWQRGFDEALMLDLYRHREPTGRLNGAPQSQAGWADAWIVEEAIDFIRRHRDEPFFAFVPTMTPHAPLRAPDRWVEHYRQKGLSDALSKLYGMVSFFDEQLGRLLNQLQSLGLAENTIVALCSDNGPAINLGLLSDEDRRIRNVNDMRGFKGDL
jgi:arylsulfatase A-like enzyme